MLIKNENSDQKALSSNLENYSWLREKAMEYIRQTSSEIWTDHNIHDPGITILEAICYALADAGYRLNFPVADLITGKEGKLVENAFYTAGEILPSHPVTIGDFRKLLVDLPTVRNAWITPLVPDQQKVETDYEKMFFYRKESCLLTEDGVKKLPVPASEKNAILSDCAVFISGLYAINIEFEPQPFTGNIDSGESFEAVYEKDYFGDIYYDIANWNELINRKNILSTISSAWKNDKKQIALKFEVSDKNKYNNSDGKLYDRILKEWVLNIYLTWNSQHIFTFRDVVFVPYFNDNRGIAGKDLIFFLTRNDFAFFNTCFEKITLLAAAYSDIQKVLHAHRNLCEDFLPQVSAIPTLDFRICADIDVRGDADIEQVQAAIFHAVEQYLTPAIKFRTFGQMVDKGYAVEDILEGPLLQHGFVCDDETGENSFRNYSVNLSDIINAISEIDGLVNCRNVRLILKDDKGKNLISGKSWEINIPEGFKPVLNKRRCKFIFYKNELPLTPDFRESYVKYTFLNASVFKETGTGIPEPVLNNRFRDLARHFSLADEFPATYKIGRNFPDEFINDPDLVPSKQLEGYLLLFEQMIANFLKDLEQLKMTLSWNDVQHIHHASSENEWRRDYLLKGSDIDKTWQKIVENRQEFLRNRNESLDYLLSRFAEDLSGLDNFFYLTSDNLNLTEEDYYVYLTGVKQNFLKNYIAISKNRGAAVDYYSSPTYGQAAVSGYENRIGRILGCEFTKNNLRKTINDINKSDKNERGYFHLFEHILLRIPQLNDAILQELESRGTGIELLSICADNDCSSCGCYDPYSFVATLLLPAWLKVYSDVYYRDYIEKLIRRETPAAVMLRICWINEESMKAYEEKIEKWWAARQQLWNCNSTTYNSKAIAFITSQNELIRVLKDMRSEFFGATLHDCRDEGEEENNTRIFLDKTILGNPNNDD